MAAPTLAISPRTRSTPYSSRVESAGVKSYTVYNHMLLPTQFRGTEADYWHLRRAVQVWDVACERQVELVGPDAARLAQMLTVRDLRAFNIGRCGYAPIVDDDGLLINDPIVIRVDNDRFWFSIADSDLMLWAGGIARCLGLEVQVSEPDIWPLAGALSALTLGLFKNKILTRDQVTSLMADNVVSPGAKGLADLGIVPTAIGAVIPEYLWRFRPSGQYAAIKESAKNLRKI